jgi:hypothetical protein
MAKADRSAHDGRRAPASAPAVSRRSLGGDRLAVPVGVPDVLIHDPCHWVLPMDLPERVIRAEAVRTRSSSAPWHVLTTESE